MLLKSTISMFKFDIRLDFIIITFINIETNMMFNHEIYTQLQPFLSCFINFNAGYAMSVVLGSKTGVTHLR